MKELVVLGQSRLSVPGKIAKYRSYVTSMTGNANFTTPSPTLASITSGTNTLETAYLAAQGGGPDDTANMRAKEAAIDLLVKSLGFYVESIANANPLTAEAVILSAGMNVKGKGGRVTRDFELKVTGNPGEIKIACKGVKRGTYEFQMSTDVTNEANWQEIYNGTRGTFVKSGLNSGTRYYFRSSLIDKNGRGAWSTVLTMIAL